MNIIDFSKKFSLTRSNGWKHVSLKTSIGSIFYDYAFELDEMNLMWVAFVSSDQLLQIDRYHFHRDDPFTAGSNPYRPYFLLVTDGKRWYFSHPGLLTFSKTTLKVLRAEIFKVLLRYKNLLPKDGSATSLQRNFLWTMMGLHRVIKRDNSAEKNKLFFINTTDLFTGSGSFRIEKTDRPDAMEKVVSEEASESSSKNKSDTAANYWKKEHDIFARMMHIQLVKTFTNEQIKALIRLEGLFVYVNPWFNFDQILIRVSDADVSVANEENKKVNSTFYYLDAAAVVYPLEFESQVTNFFRLDRELLSEVMDDF